MAFNFNRYKLYTQRNEVYLFTLRDYCEMLMKIFGGTMLVRDDMPIKGGYLMAYPQESINAISRFVKSESDTAVDLGSLVKSSKVFLKSPISKDFEGDGTTKNFAVASNLSAVVADYTLTVDNSTVALTLKEDKTGATFTGGSIDFATGTITFTAAPEEGTAISIQTFQVNFLINYQLFDSKLYVGLGVPDAVLEGVIPTTTLPADGTTKTFNLEKNLKAGTVKIVFKNTAEGSAVTVTDNGAGVFESSDETPVVYGTIDYMSGVLTLETAPVSLTYEGTYFKEVIKPKAVTTQGVQII